MTHVLSEWGVLAVITQDHNIYLMREKDTQSKLEDLFKKHLYSIAISLAVSSQYDIASIMDIYRMYGDHLYRCGAHPHHTLITGIVISLLTASSFMFLCLPAAKVTSTVPPHNTPPPSATLSRHT